MGFAFFVIALLLIGFVIVSAAISVLSIPAFIFFLFMGIKLRKTEKKLSVKYFIAAGVTFAMIAHTVTNIIIAKVQFDPEQYLPVTENQALSFNYVKIL